METGQPPSEAAASSPEGSNGGRSQASAPTGRAASHSRGGAGAAAAPALAPAPQPQITHEQDRSPGTITTLGAVREIKLAITRVVIVCATAFTLRYFYWRATDTMNPAAKIFFYIFFVAEALNFVEALLFYVTTWSPTRYASPEPLVGRSVDVFIATYDEPIELLRETVLCANNMIYPHKTFLLDDGNREQVRQLATEFGCNYLSRTERTHAKAGNLNHALANTHGEFVVTLDADHVPAPDLIEKLIGFFTDAQVAAVQTTQHFYNMDSFQHRMDWKSRAGWQQQELFFSVIQPGKDRFGAAFYCGSPAMLRRAALESVGGFATETITEDMHTGLRLQKKQWRVLYHNKTLAYGLAPQTFIGFATQWQRWGSGCMQVMRVENPIVGRGLRFGQRICYFASMYFYWMSYQKLLYLLTPVVALLSGLFPLVTTPRIFAEYFLPYFFLNLFASVLLQGGFSGYFRSEQFNVLKMHVLMRTISGLLPRKTNFKVTPKSRADAAGLADVFLPVVICFVLVAALVAGVLRLIAGTDDFLFWALLVNLTWSAFYLFMMVGVLWSAVRKREMRAMYRFPARLETPVKLRFTNEDGVSSEVSEFARNLNRGGVSVTLDRPIRLGTAVELELRVGERIICASGEVVRNDAVKLKARTRVSNGIRFSRIDVRDQDEISKYLFWQIAPREQSALTLTHMSQREA